MILFNWMFDLLLEAYSLIHKHTLFKIHSFNSNHFVTHIEQIFVWHSLPRMDDWISSEGGSDDGENHILCSLPYLEEAQPGRWQTKCGTGHGGAAAGQGASHGTSVHISIDAAARHGGGEGNGPSFAVTESDIMLDVIKQILPLAWSGG